MHYFLNIGSNLGNRKLNISKALRAIEERFGYFETSKIVESSPWGYESVHDFMNLAVMVVSDRTPLEVLSEIQKIENHLNPTPHRHSDGSYADRILDIDIMAADDVVMSTPGLILPHPRLSERRFFLEPFSQLAPLWRHPVSGLTCAEMLDLLHSDNTAPTS